MFTSALLLLASPIVIMFINLVAGVANVNFMQPAINGINLGMGYFYSFMQMLDPLIPYTHQLIVLNIIITYYALLFIFKMVSWFARKIPFIGIS